VKTKAMYASVSKFINLVTLSSISFNELKHANATCANIRRDQRAIEGRRSDIPTNKRIKYLIEK